VLLEIVSVLLLVAGFFFLAVGTIGLLRMPDVYTRMHATAKCDTLGAALVLTAMILQCNSVSNAAKLVMIWVFFWLINPAVTHMIADTALGRGVELTPGTDWIDHYDPAGKEGLEQ
jgi:multicomponent Na+:H+ antiporter subunit G